MHISPADISFTAIRSPGNGGQNVNKVSTAIHLRFDIPASGLPVWLKDRLLARADSRITADGIIIIKAHNFRTQEQNREDATARLQDLVDAAAVTEKKRKSTKATRGSQVRRLAKKSIRGDVKANRRRPDL